MQSLVSAAVGAFQPTTSPGNLRTKPGYCAAVNVKRASSFARRAAAAESAPGLKITRTSPISIAPAPLLDGLCQTRGRLSPAARGSEAGPWQSSGFC
jgi:hypothetical protein